EAGDEARGAADPLDLRVALTLQHKRMVAGLGALLGNALRRSSEARWSLEHTVTFGLSFDDLRAVQWDDATETEAETESETETEAEPETERTRPRVEFASDTDDPLAGLF
ncbi:MAG: hypothetical protein AB1Z98_09440, partial [Nannocystaceae bacterium]